MNSSFDRATEGKNEWLTPPDIIKALGPFDLDPCTPAAQFRPWPTAVNHYSFEDNGDGRARFRGPVSSGAIRLMGKKPALGSSTAPVMGPLLPWCLPARKRTLSLTRFGSTRPPSSFSKAACGSGNFPARPAGLVTVTMQSRVRRGQSAFAPHGTRMQRRFRVEAPARLRFSLPTVQRPFAGSNVAACLGNSFDLILKRGTYCETLRNLRPLSLRRRLRPLLYGGGQLLLLPPMSFHP